METLTRDEAIERLRNTIKSNDDYDKKIAEVKENLKQFDTPEVGMEH